MPTPVGHALAGVAIGWLVDGRRGHLDGAAITTAAAYACVAVLPDLDLLLPTHRGPTHGIGSAGLAGIIAWVLTRRGRAALAFALAYGSHILLDWLGTDTTPPIGLMALWPFSREYYESPYQIFMAVSRRYWLPEFWTYNFRVLVRELLILGPLVIVAGAVRGPRLRGTAAVLVCLGLHTACASEASAQAAPARSYYEAAIAQYRAGEFDTAVEAISRLGAATPDDVQWLFARNSTGGLPRAGVIKAAILLHSEAHVLSRSGQFPALPAPHLDSPRRIARRYLELTHDREFVRQWHLLAVSHFHGMRHMDRCAALLAEARTLFPGDAEVLLASGAHHEMLAQLGSIRLPILNSLGQKIGDEVVSVQQELARASAHLRAAIVSKPELYEGRLRLGRVLYLSGDLAAAAEEIDIARTRSRQPPLQYLGSLFLALVEEDRGRSDRAALLYGDAARIFPAAQAPRVGRSELFYRDRQPAGAAATIEALLDTPAPEDPWWTYLLGVWWHFSPRLAALREQVRQ